MYVRPSVKSNLHFFFIGHDRLHTLTFTNGISKNPLALFIKMNAYIMQLLRTNPCCNLKGHNSELIAVRFTSLTNRLAI